jgi:hypothetical protein
MANELLTIWPSSTRRRSRCRFRRGCRRGQGLYEETSSATAAIATRVDSIQRDVAVASESISGIVGIVEMISSLQATVASAVEEQATGALKISLPDSRHGRRCRGARPVWVVRPLSRREPSLAWSRLPLLAPMTPARTTRSRCASGAAGDRRCPAWLSEGSAACARCGLH